jgi:pyridinium-3,5-biscarboxylic acid mononucleotide sulfurtransferase
MEEPLPIRTALAAKEEALIHWLRDQGSALLGYSGGVDSAYLACVASEALGSERFLAVIGRSASYPDAQWQAALAVAREYGLPVEELATDELNDSRYVANPANRCYFCKAELWSKLVPLARERGMAVVMDGTNADDLVGHRPGRLAADECGVLSPLALLGFSKADVRLLSHRRGLPTWSAPSSPCLSSRIPHGIDVTATRLRQIEAAEHHLREIGIRGDLRVRYYGTTARVELAPEELAVWSDSSRRSTLDRAVKSAGFADVELDPRGYRSGSLQESLTQLQLRR